MTEFHVHVWTVVVIILWRLECRENSEIICIG